MLVLLQFYHKIIEKEATLMPVYCKVSWSIYQFIVIPPRIRPPGKGGRWRGADLRIPRAVWWELRTVPSFYTSKTGSYYIRGGRGGGEKQGQNRYVTLTPL
jgi:hypothetical protein